MKAVTTFSDRIYWICITAGNTFVDSLEHLSTVRSRPPHALQSNRCVYLKENHRNDLSALFEIGVALYEMISQTNPNVRMLVVNRAGHFHYREYPQEFNHNVTQFIRFWG